MKQILVIALFAVALAVAQTTEEITSATPSEEDTSAVTTQEATSAVTTQEATSAVTDEASTTRQQSSTKKTCSNEVKARLVRVATAYRSMKTTLQLYRATNILNVCQCSKGLDKFLNERSPEIEEELKQAIENCDESYAPDFRTDLNEATDSCMWPVKTAVRTFVNIVLRLFGTF